MPRLILASSSPRRRELLQEAGFSFEKITPASTAECGVCSHETPPELVARLALQKASDVVHRLRHARAGTPNSSTFDTIIIGCDTVAECAGRILGKPADASHARSMLTLLRGREHRVYSGLCLRALCSDETHVQVDRTTLRMDLFSESQLEEYLASGLWEGKAGAFGYQDRPGWLHIVEGSESNVVGLPIELLRTMLANLGVATPHRPNSSSLGCRVPGC